MIAAGAADSLPSAASNAVVLTGSTNTITIPSPAASASTATKYRVYVSNGGTWTLQAAGTTNVGTPVTLTSYSATTAAPTVASLPDELMDNCGVLNTVQGPGAPLVYPQMAAVAPWVRWKIRSSGNVANLLSFAYSYGMDHYYTIQSGYTGGNGGTAAGTGYFWNTNSMVSSSTGIGTWTTYTTPYYYQHLSGWDALGASLPQVLFHGARSTGDVYTEILEASPYYFCTLAADGLTLTVDYGYMSATTGGTAKLQFQSGQVGNTGFIITRNGGEQIPIASATCVNYIASAAEINEHGTGNQPATTTQMRSQVIVTLGRRITAGQSLTMIKRGGALVNSAAYNTPLPDFPTMQITNNSQIARIS